MHFPFKSPKILYLRESSFRDDPNVYSIDGDAQHGGERQKPAKNVAPHGEIIVVGVQAHRLVLDQTEDECDLKKR